MHGGTAVAVEVRILSTLPRKNVAKSSAESLEVADLDSGCSTVFTARQRACGFWL